MTSSQIHDPLVREGLSNSPPDVDLIAGPHRGPGRRRVGSIVASSLIAGFVAAAGPVAAPFVGTRENAVTGVVLLGFALGWALLAALSMRWSDQPQRWAFVPAVFMAVAGGVLIVGSETLVHGVLDWVWPPALVALVVWMIVRARRQLRSRTRRWLLYPVFVALVVASVGSGYQTVRASVDARAYPMAGQLIDVGGHRLHLHCTGSGSPTVVLEPGLGEISSIFGWIAPAVARDTRVCVYDRAGRGWSESGPGPQDGVQIATDLHTLLDHAQIPGPYVLAGHSFGGLYVLAFAARYPDQVAGLVLLDSTAPAPSTTPPDTAGSYSVLGRALSVLPTLARLGGTRLVCFSSYSSLPPQARDEERASCATPRQARSAIDELGESTTAMAQAKALTDFAGKPLAVVTAGSGHDADWLSAQDDLATLSTNTTHRVVPSATHASLLEAESDANASSRAILDVVASVRTGQPLST
jgi:pimeloyl-ACP methyl ester carboxylesterase